MRKICARSNKITAYTYSKCTFLASGSIDCYSCSSVNGTDPHCEDPIAPAYQTLQRRCMVPKEHHVGKFPANFCIKMIGTSSECIC